MGYGLFWVMSFLLGSPAGQITLAAVVLWYLDNRYFGLLGSLWQPIARAQRIANLRHAVELNPSDVRSMVQLGEHYLRAGRYQLAADYLERAFNRGEDSARALYLLGAAMVKLGKHAEGKAKLEAALAEKADVAFGEPYIYLLEEALATRSPESPRIDELVVQIERFDGVEVLTRAGRVCAAAGRKDLARRLLEEALHNYSFIPPRMRRRERRWMVRARLALMRIK